MSGYFLVCPSTQEDSLLKRKIMSLQVQYICVCHQSEIYIMVLYVVLH